MKTAVIIDDDSRAVLIASDIAKRMGFAAHSFPTADEALQRSPALHPQLFLVEIKLDDALGFEVTRAIRKHPSLYQAEVLLTSNACERKDVEYGLQEGADSFLRKPFSADDCLESVSAMQRLHAQVQESCPITGFGSVYGLRREIDHLIFREEDFALCYLIPKGLSKLRHDNNDVRLTQATQTTAQLIRNTLSNDGFYETYCSHLGSGHFMVKISSEDWKRFYKCVTERFASAHVDGKNGSCLPSPTLRFGVAVSRGERRYRHSIDMFHDVRNGRSDQGIEASVEKSRPPHPAPKPRGHNHWAD